MGAALRKWTNTPLWKGQGALLMITRYELMLISLFPTVVCVRELTEFYHSAIGHFSLTQ